VVVAIPGGVGVGAGGVGVGGFGVGAGGVGVGGFGVGAGVCSDPLVHQFPPHWLHLDSLSLHQGPPSTFPSHTEFALVPVVPILTKSKSK